jgi:hypothetical protein
VTEFSEEAKKLAPHSNGYLYWINGGCHVTWTHPNDWKFEDPDGINYIKTFAGMKKPGVLFEGWDILRAIEQADSLDQLHEAFQWRISLEDEIDRDEFLENPGANTNKDAKGG